MNDNNATAELKRPNILFNGPKSTLETPVVTEGKKLIYTQLWNETTEKEYLTRVKKQATLAATQIINQAMQEANTIRVQAEKMGYLQGEKAGKNFIENKSVEYIQHFEHIIQAMEEYTQQVYTSLENEISSIICLCVEKITGILLSEDRKNILTKMLEEIRNNLSNEHAYTLYVNKEDYSIFQEIIEDRMQPNSTYTWRLEVSEDIPIASCRFENEHLTTESNFESRKVKVLDVLKQLQFK